MMSARDGEAHALKKRSRVTHFFPAHLNERKSAIKKSQIAPFPQNQRDSTMRAAARLPV